jgi:hypothetical protein
VDVLKDLKGLTNLTLILIDSNINNLSVIGDLSDLKVLEIAQNQSYVLDVLPRSVTTLRLSDRREQEAEW